jgi:hypothetical protein
MSTDSDPISVGHAVADDFGSLLLDIFSGIPYKSLILMFIIFIFISSSVFIGRILGKVNGAVNGTQPTNYGTVLQGIILVMGCILVDAAIKNKII